MSTITLHLTDYDGTPRSFSARTGRSLMKAAIDGGADGIAADCGGCLTCATCHVIVAPEWLARLPPRSRDEEAMLDMAAHPREPGSRLSCQIELTPEMDGLAVRVAPTQY
jgi:2Fe-2S ferredoxin